MSGGCLGFLPSTVYVPFCKITFLLGLKMMMSSVCFFFVMLKGAMKFSSKSCHSGAMCWRMQDEPLLVANAVTTPISGLSNVGL